MLCTAQEVPYPAVPNLSLLRCSDTEAQCEVMQEIVDQVLEVRGNQVLRESSPKLSQLPAAHTCSQGIELLPSLPPDEALLAGH